MRKLTGVAGPSTALRFAQDEGFVVGMGRAVGLSPETPPFRKKRERMGHPEVGDSWGICEARIQRTIRKM